MANYDLDQDKLESILALNEARWRYALHIQSRENELQRLQQQEADYKKWRGGVDRAINRAITQNLAEVTVTCKRNEKMNKRVMMELKKHFRVYKRISWPGPRQYVIKLC